MSGHVNVILTEPAMIAFASCASSDQCSALQVAARAPYHRCHRSMSVGSIQSSRAATLVQASHGGGGGGGGGGARRGREAVLEIEKLVHKRVRVKFTGGREGATGAPMCL